MKKLIEALHVIQEECNKRDDCNKCPFYSNGCKIHDDYPFDWEIEESQKVLL